MVESIQPSSLGNGCYIILIQIPLIASVGLGMIVAREATNLFTLLVFGPWLGAMWRARSYLADATAVQLTRNPDALSSAVRTLADSDVVVPSGWPVHFLFPAWVRMDVQLGAAFAGASMHAARMRLEPEPRLRRLAALGALTGDHSRVRRTHRLRSLLSEWRDVRNLVAWIVLAGGLIAVLMVVTVLSASLLLMLLWYVLRWIAAPLRFLRDRSP